MRLSPAAQLAVIGLGTLVVPLDTTVNVAFPHIVARFGIGMETIKWVVICYVGVHASLMLVCGRLGDLFGYRRVFLIGCAWSAAAFALCAAAPSYPVLLAARALQGVGAALVLSVGPGLATGAFPESRRARVLGLYTMMFAIGAAAGPPLAGVLIGVWGWSAVYAFRVPLAAASFALAWLLPAGRPAPGRPAFDIAGGALLVLAMGAGLLALDRLRAGEPFTLAALALLAAAAAAGFVRWEGRVAAPLIELRNFRDGALVFALIAAVGVNFAGFTILLLGPFLLPLVADLSPATSGLLLSASPLGMVIAAPLADRIGARFGMARLTLAGLAVTAAGLAGMGWGAAGIGAMAGAMFVQGFGQGLFQVANIDAVTGALPPRDRGVAGSLAMLTRTFGLMLGATLLMLLMHLLAAHAAAGGAGAAPGATPGAATVAGIEGTYRVAALIPLALALAAWRIMRRG